MEQLAGNYGNCEVIRIATNLRAGKSKSRLKRETSPSRHSRHQFGIMAWLLRSVALACNRLDRGKHRTQHVNLNPIHATDSAAICSGWADGVGAGELNPTVVNDASYFRGKLGEILILTEYHRNIVLVFAGKADDIECQADVDPFFLSDQNCGGLAARQLHCLVAVFQVAGECFDSATPHDRQLRRPEIIPERGILHLRKPGVEVRFC
jgi:hypothetical protein